MLENLPNKKNNLMLHAYKINFSIAGIKYNFFVEPPVRVINYLESNYNFDSYYIVGISGGGWVTTLVPAIDDRINQSFSIAGSYPMFLRSEPKNFGDSMKIMS